MHVDSHDLTQDLPPEVVHWWRNTVSACAAPPEGADMTSAPEWHAALARAFRPQGGTRLLVARERGGEIAAALPVYLRHAQRLGHFGQTVALPTELYGGRMAWLGERNATAAVASLLRAVDAAFPRWSSFEMTLVDGNLRTERMLQSLRDCTCAVASMPLARSPYISLPDSFEDYFKSLKPNFRTEVRRGERRLRETGELTRRLFAAPEEIEALWDSVCRIERESWKEAAGTSITTNPQQERFYREFLPYAAAGAQLLAPVLYLDGRPIAHKLCLVRDGVAAILKMSYVEDLKRFYPSTVLLAGYLQDLVARSVRFLDFMGVCDDFKMRWTSLTYGRTKHVLFRDSLGGRLAHARFRLVLRLASIRDRERMQTPDAADA
jgi:CelD/BcsL family acetyltransferase involved in cellulose biosynthesis